MQAFPATDVGHERPPKARRTLVPAQAYVKARTTQFEFESFALW